MTKLSIVPARERKSRFGPDERFGARLRSGQVEYLLVRLDEENHRVKLSLHGHEVISEMEKTESAESYVAATQEFEVLFLETQKPGLSGPPFLRLPLLWPSGNSFPIRVPFYGTV